MQTAPQMESRTKQLSKLGQSIWLDFISRSFLNEGKLKGLVEQDGLRGVTSNPSIFEGAIAKGSEYLEEMKSLVGEKHNAMDIYERLAVKDIQAACDALRLVYDETLGRDGYVSMEVSPYLAHETQGTIDEAKRLWAWVDRPNLMVKIPATHEGLPAIRAVIAEGINVNVTLLFAQDMYKEVAFAYMAGLEDYVKKHGASANVGNIASVASFFVSRIDANIDAKLQKMIDNPETSEVDKKLAKNLLGKIAIANAKMAYQDYREIYTSERWKALLKASARPQRLLWASTSTKNKAYPDCLYVDELIGNETVNTLPMPTLEAFRDHGKPVETLEKDVEGAREQLETLERLGISLEEITATLLDEGVKSFATSFTKLLSAVETHRRAARKLATVSVNLPEALKASVDKYTEEWVKEKKVEKLWAKDASLWSGTDEAQWLEWLTIVQEELNDSATYEKLMADKSTKFEYVVLLGMGGSSLCPEVMSHTFCTPAKEGFPKLLVLDSTNPQRIADIDNQIEVAKTLFVVASKSGSTLEPNVMAAHYTEKVEKEVGGDAGKHFIAITDPGSSLEKLAKEKSYRHIFYGKKAIGGRYSALSKFGMIPASLAGIDTKAFLESAQEMVDTCNIFTPEAENPGLTLGIILGACQRAGRDKLTIATSKSLSSVGNWIEQLIAESLGKSNVSIIPIVNESPLAASAYQQDRLFVTITLASDKEASISDALVKELVAAGQPVVQIKMNDKMDLGQEFFRWEIATAVAGSIMGINTFNQPDVESAKIATRALTKAFEEKGRFDYYTPFWGGDAKLDMLGAYSDKKNEEAIKSKVTGEPSLAAILRAHLERIQAGDYFSILAFLEMNDQNVQSLEIVRKSVEEKFNTSTTLGFGPRYLHSTGQAHKGGANNGVFLVITSDYEKDMPVPGYKSTFGNICTAQAYGDAQVLCEKGRRVLHLHLTKNVARGLASLIQETRNALS
ncbi:bifunctional transaldolase/phosoglucose isomerase [bacterium]|nr:bifunctional transaldolase/phosoglucose isomerase [bacterium]